MCDFIDKAKVIHGDKYNYDYVDYVNAKTHVILLCNNCNTPFSIRPTNHLQSHGCRRCNCSGGYSEDKIKSDKRLRTKRYYLYYVKLTNKINGKVFYKIGLEHIKYSRWSNCSRYDVEYIHHRQGILSTLFRKEQDIKAKYSLGVDKLDWSFGGHTEMIDYDFLKVTDVY